MANLLPMIISAILRISQGPLSKRLNRSEKIQQIFNELGIKGDPSPHDFDAIYVHTLVEYGVDRPEPVLKLWRNDIIRNSFRKSFESDDPSILIEEVENIIQINMESEILGKIDYDLRLEIDEFIFQFHSIIDRVKSIIDIKQDHTITNLLETVEHHDIKIDALSHLTQEIRSKENRILIPPTPIIVSPPNLLPQYYVERTEQLSELRDFLKIGVDSVKPKLTPDVIAIVGIGGIGKTILALSITKENGFSKRFPGGVIWLEESVYSSSVNEALSDWLLALGINPQSFPNKSSMMQAIRNRLITSPMLIVIDNALNIPFSRTILDCTHQGSSIILITREPELPARLGIETILRLIGFTPDEARHVINNRTKSTISDDEWESIVEPTLKRIGFHPLATSLAAAQISMGDTNWADLSSQLLIGEIGDAIDFSNPKLASESIQLTFKKSLVTLDDDLRRKIQWLSVLSLGKPFSLPDAAMILSGMPENRSTFKGIEGRFGLEAHPEYIEKQTELALESLNVMIRRGILDRIQPNGFLDLYTFHPLFQAVALQELRETGELDDAILHHAWVYSSLIHSEVDVPALLHPYSYTRHQILEVLERSWSTIGDGTSIPLPSREFAENSILSLTLLLSKYFELKGQYKELLKWSYRALQVSQAVKDKIYEHELYRHIGRSHLNLGELIQAEYHLKFALRLSKELNDESILLRDQVNIAILEIAKGNSSSAIQTLKECEELARKNNDEEILGIILGTISSAYLRENNPYEGIPYEEEALSLAIKNRNQIAEGSRLGNLGVLLYLRSQKDLERAIGLFHRSRLISLNTGNLQSQANHLMNLARSYKATFRPQLVMICIEEAIRVLKEIGSSQLEIAEAIKISLDEETPDFPESIEWSDIFELTEASVFGDRISKARLELYIKSVRKMNHALPDLIMLLDLVELILAGERDPEKIFHEMDNPPINLMLLVHNIMEPGIGFLIHTIGLLVSQSIHNVPGANDHLNGMYASLQQNFPLPEEKSGLSNLILRTLEGEKNPTNLVSNIKNRFLRATLKSIISSDPKNFRPPKSKPSDFAI